MTNVTYGQMNKATKLSLAITRVTVLDLRSCSITILNLKLLDNSPIQKVAFILLQTSKHQIFSQH